MTDAISIEDVLDRLISIIAEHLGVNKSNVILTTHLADDLGLTDSIDVVEMMFRVGEHFGVELLDKEVKELVTVEDIVSLLVDKLPAKSEIISDKLVTDPDNIFDRVKAIIVDRLEVDESAVTLEAKLVENLGADSLGVVELVMLIDEEFDVEVSDKELGEFVTVKDIINFLSGNPERSEKVISPANDGNPI